jgi:hypothetical protein
MWEFMYDKKYESDLKDRLIEKLSYEKEEDQVEINSLR